MRCFQNASRSGYGTDTALAEASLPSASNQYARQLPFTGRTTREDEDRALVRFNRIGRGVETTGEMGHAGLRSAYRTVRDDQHLLSVIPPDLQCRSILRKSKNIDGQCDQHASER